MMNDLSTEEVERIRARINKLRDASQYIRHLEGIIDEVRARVLLAYPSVESLPPGHFARELLDITKGVNHGS